MKFRLNLAGVPVDVTTQYDEYYPYFSPSNEITRLTVHESAGKVFSQFLFDCNTEQEAKTACRIAEKMLKTPVWLLKNRGDIESAKLCRKTLQTYLDSPDFH